MTTVKATLYLIIKVVQVSNTFGNKNDTKPNAYPIVRPIFMTVNFNAIKCPNLLYIKQ